MPKPRKESKLRPFKTFKIFCEGEKTEPYYLKGYIATLDNDAGKKVFEVPPTENNTAAQLVDEAIDAKNSPNALPGDEFWVVYDRESPAKYPDQLHAEALLKAQQNGINIALCNVCFEYWILIHMIETDAPYQNCGDVLKNSPLKVEFKKLSGKEYKKAASNTFTYLQDLVADARRRGARINRRGLEEANKGMGQPHQINPYVGVVKLLDAIDAFVAEEA